MAKRKSLFGQGVKVRMKGNPDSPIGVIADHGKLRTWWVVEYPDGSKKPRAERHLEIVHQ